MIVRISLLGTLLIGCGTVLLGEGPAISQIRLDTVNIVPCAEEGGICRMPYPTNVYFGIPGKTHGRPFPQGGTVPCKIQSFGDPAPNQRKSCWYAPRITDNGGGYREDARPRRDYDRDDDRPRRDDRYRDDDRGRRDFNGDYDDRPRRPYDDGGSERRRYRNPDDE